jgi:NAD+-dependent protein deacetylase SIR2
MASFFQKSEKARPTPFHEMLKVLNDRGRVVRVYSQNIDGLELKVGLTCALPSAEDIDTLSISGQLPRVLPMHGLLSLSRCSLCNNEMLTSSVVEAYSDGQLPNCPRCTARCQARLAKGGRALAIGLIRPSIVLYDEPVPEPYESTVGTVFNADFEQCAEGKRPDLFVVVGTRLSVPGTVTMVKNVAKSFSSASRSSGKPQMIYINIDPDGPPSSVSGLFDLCAISDAQAVAMAVLDIVHRAA